MHAEAIALYKALSEGYTKIQAVGVTSDDDQIKPLCGACRQLYMYVNPMTAIYVFGKDKKVKLKVKLIDTMNIRILVEVRSLKVWKSKALSL